MGIRTEELDRVFDPKCRSDTLRMKKSTQAYALLAIELEMRSEVSQGATFTLHFPANGPAIRQ